MILKLLCYVTGALKDVVRDERIPWDPDSESIIVTTASVAGSNEDVQVRFYDGNIDKAGSILIQFATQIQYKVQKCMDEYTPFSVTVPTEAQKTWTFTYDFQETRVVYYCNEVEVLNLQLTSVCFDDYTWNIIWRSYKPTQIMFGRFDTASDRYSVSAGKYNGSH